MQKPSNYTATLEFVQLRRFVASSSIGDDGSSNSSSSLTVVVPSAI
jgi:hypothetical protein